MSQKSDIFQRKLTAAIGLASRQSVACCVMELGVFRGATFAVMARAAKSAGVWPIAVDSWEGMPEPGPQDAGHYPRGKFGHVGIADFHSAMAAGGLARVDYQAVQGYVPAVLETFEPPPILFAHLDMDQYASTLAAAEWAWTRLVPGGTLAFHDWLPGREDILASGAAHAFVRSPSVRESVQIETAEMELFATKPEQHTWR